MIDYLYDGSFEGILTCIYHHYYTDRAAGIYRKEDYQPSLLHGFMEVETEADKATRVYEAIENKISTYSLRSIYRAYLSCDPDKENKILRYVLLGFQKGHQTGSLHGNPAVKDIDALTKKVGYEQERMLQFVRFEVLDAKAGQQVLYAEIEPDNDVLELAAGHFAERFRHDPVVIRDARRNKAVVAYEGHWYVTPLGERLGSGAVVAPDGTVMELSQDEIDYQHLWQTYFDHIAIKERINPRCQKNFMPVRYWKHLTEMNRR